MDFESHINEATTRTRTTCTTSPTTATITTSHNTLHLNYNNNEGAMGRIHWNLTHNTTLIKAGSFEVTSTMILADEIARLIEQ